LTRSVAVWWVKRDARLTDNACLAEAERLGPEVLPFFCFEPSLLSADDTSDIAIRFLQGATNRVVIIELIFAAVILAFAIRICQLMPKNASSRVMVVFLSSLAAVAGLAI
jgi:hypothetical protein